MRAPVGAALAAMTFGAAAAGFSASPAQVKPYRVLQAEAKVGRVFWAYLDTPVCQATLRITSKPEISSREKYESESPVKVSIVGVHDDGVVSWLKLQIGEVATGYLLDLKAPKMEPLKEGDSLLWRCYSIETPDVVAEFRAAEEARKGAIAAACEVAGYKRGIPQVGMSEWDVVECALGKPDSINRTITADGTRQQWVYSLRKTYVYIEGGKVTAVQN